MQKTKKYVDRTLEFVTGTLFAVMVAVTMWQVIGRYIFNNPSTVSEEFLRFSLVWLSFLAAAYALGKNSHIAFTLLRDRLTQKKKLSIDLAIQASFLAFATVIMIYGGGKAVSLTMEQISPSLNVPMGLVYLALPVSGIFVLFYSIVNLIDIFAGRKREVAQEEMMFINKSEVHKEGEVT